LSPASSNSDTGQPRNEPKTDESYTLPKEYNPLEEEPKWQKWWMEKNFYHYDPADRTRPTYSIDTPPPYPSGELHVGNALNWCYFDFVARYKRMRGYNVHFPQGWDCHGLPTEVNAEKTFKVKKNDIPPAQFVEMCRKLTEETISRMKTMIIRLGTSNDWGLEYRTMDPSYYGLTQRSFLQLYNTGYIYHGEHPVNWCPRCETAIAEAEVEHVQRQGLLHFIRFGDAHVELKIATSRPELIAACVAIAVHPEDTRHTSQVGRKIEIPLFGRTVPIIADEEVDRNFGSGAVMVCTFGDKMDVKWQIKHGLPLIRAIAGNGRLTDEAGEFKGLKIEEARKRIVEKLTGEKRLLKSEPLSQNIGVCWRCKTSVEIISRPQWFMKTREMKEQVTQWADKLRWVPAFAKQRMVDWAESLDWDWVISRQRVFATPIPLWYCKKCGNIMPANEHDLPVDPRHQQPSTTQCPKCGSTDFRGEADVLDTWMDSSISAAVHAGWPDNHSEFNRLFPADLQPNGLDIVRTWDYYLLVRSLALFQKAPYKTLLINGMVRGTDGRMMHKSYGNYVETGEALGKFGADSFRQWAAAGGSTGYDTPFRWADVEHGKKFLTKLWNVARFILSNLPPSIPREKPDNLTTIDKWLLSSLHELVRQVTDSLENFQFNAALESIRDFTWHTLADNYLETAKYRLHPEGTTGNREAAQYCLHESLTAICRLIAPFCPHISESIYQQLPNDQKAESVHSDKWPEPDPALLQKDWIGEGKIVIETIASARRKKAEKGLSLKTPLKSLVIDGSRESLEVLQKNQEPILRTLNASTLLLRAAETGSSQKGALVIEVIA
jgi:valyl-tRNA synthetase